MPDVLDPPEKLESATAIVHLEYDVERPPAPPGPGWTRFVCISDTHERTFPVPDGDVLLHSGDLTETGRYYGFERTMEWLYSLPHPTKIVVAGNHDLSLHKDWYDSQYTRWHREQEDLDLILDFMKGEKARQAGLVYLEDERYEFRAKTDGRLWSVYGSPWSPYFHNWAFNYRRGEEAERLVSQFPKADILLTHGPPYNLFDTTTRGEHVGCEALASRLPSLRPRIHVFGHIHEGHGAEIRDWPWPSLSDDQRLNSERTVFVNAANWPMGPLAKALGPDAQFGGPRFRPVIVDLLDGVQ